MTDPLDAALASADLGMRITPVWGIVTPGKTEEDAQCSCGNDACETPGKHPAIKGFLEAATAGHSQIQKWLGNGAVRNYGIVLGNHWTVVEVDPYQGGSLRALRDIVGELGPISTSGRGFHVFFGESNVPNGTKLGPGMTVRGAGYIVVGPGSRHWTGRHYGRRRYGWDRMRERPSLVVHGVEQAKRQRVKMTGEPIPDGTRNDSMASIAGQLVALHPPEEALALALAYDLVNGKPPLGEERIRRMVSDFVEKDRAKPALMIVADEAEADVAGGPETLADALAAVLAYVQRYVVFPSPSFAQATALWIAATWEQGWEAVPYLGVTSPQRQSGKTRLLEVLELLVRTPWRTSMPSASALFSKMDAARPVLLLDEVDAIFHKNAGESAEALRAVLDAGNRVGGSVPRVRMVGQNRIVDDFSVFGFKAFAGIHRLPETLDDRSIVVPMSRKLRAERVERFRWRRAKLETLPLRGRLSALVGAAHEALIAFDWNAEEIPELSDREAEGWEPLLAIAEAAGGDWPKIARGAAREIHGRSSGDDAVGADTLLLQHCREVFEQQGKERLSTFDLVVHLRQRDDGPWSVVFDDRFDDDAGSRAAYRLAQRLRPYGIHSRQLRDGQIRTKGYWASDFAEAWERWL